MQTERARWLDLVPDVKVAQQVCSDGATAAREATGDARRVAASLRNEVAAAEDLRAKALEALEVGETRAESLSQALQAAESVRSDMQNATRRTEQITDDLYRGLNAAVESQRQCETRVEENLAQTGLLQAEVRDILALRDGLDGFRDDAAAQNTRLDECAGAIAAMNARLDAQ